jgi:hypothetical protein
VQRVKSALHKALRQRLENGDWFVDTLPKLLSDVAALRNPAVHRLRIDRETATVSAISSWASGTAARSSSWPECA